MQYARLEPGIRELVKDFNDQGCPCPSGLDIQHRRQGYLQTISLAGEAEPVFQVQDIRVDGINLNF